VSWCRKCGEYEWSTHRCPPKWECRVVDYQGEDDWRGFYAADAEAAAEKAAERFDCGDYTLLQGDEITVVVRSSNGEESRWICTGETVPQYHAVAAEDSP
jgi:hypothetical protein